MPCPGLSLLVVGDCKGTVFGSLVEAPLRATNKRQYQGMNTSFVFTNTPGHPIKFRPQLLMRLLLFSIFSRLMLGYHIGVTGVARSLESLPFGIMGSLLPLSKINISSVIQSRKGGEN